MYLVTIDEQIIPYGKDIKTFDEAKQAASDALDDNDESEVDILKIVGTVIKIEQKVYTPTK